MKKRVKYPLHLLLTAVMAGLLISACSEEGNQSDIRPSGGDENRTLSFTDSLAFVSSQGDTVATIAVAIADEKTERTTGLMHVTELGEDEGMLFIFPQEGPRGFWMANTPLSLDIIFINADKEIVRIHRSVPPFTKQTFRSGEPAMYVVETNAGFAIAHDIREGMEVSF